MRYIIERSQLTMNQDTYTPDEAEELEALQEIELPDVDQELKDNALLAEMELEHGKTNPN